MASGEGVKHAIELHAGDQVFGTLRFDGAEAVAEVDGQRWAFTRLRKQVIVRDAHGTVAGTFTAAKRGEGQLELADGSRFRWRPTHPWQAERGFYDVDGTRVVRFWKATWLLSAEDRGAADPGRSALPQFPLLVVLGRVIGIGQDDTRRPGTTTSPQQRGKPTRPCEPDPGSRSQPASSAGILPTPTR